MTVLHMVFLLSRASTGYRKYLRQKYQGFPAFQLMVVWEKPDSLFKQLQEVRSFSQLKSLIDYIV